MRGFFRMDYAREGGAGGTIIFTDGAVSGWDTGGSFFRGVYCDSGMGIEGQLSMAFPSGGISVTGEKMAQNCPPLDYPFRIANAASAGEMEIETGSGRVVVKLRRVSAL
jgi:hypothetical protein